LSNRRASRLLVLTGLVAASSAGLCFWRSPLPDDRTFQRVTGGIGLGAAASATWSFHLYDARTESSCENEMWPIPGGICFSPYHGATVADMSPLDPHRPPRPAHR